MATVATLSNGKTKIVCATFLTPGGWIETVLQRTTEPLRTPGVDGTRLRIPRSDFKEFEAATLIGATDWNDAIKQREACHDLIGKAIGIMIIGGGRTANYINVLVHDATAVAIPGPIVGATSAAMHVSCAWRFQLTQGEAEKTP